MDTNFHNNFLASELFSLELNSNKQLKITYRGNNPLNLNLIPLLSGLRIPFQTHSFNFECSGHWWVPPINFIGCSYLRLQFDYAGKTNKIEYMLPSDIIKIPTNKKSNVICLGLNRTGTTSLKSGLESLGYNVMWEGLGHQFIQSDVWNKDYSSLSSIINNPAFNAYEDLPFSLKGIHPEIFKIDPEAKYILTIRDAKKWARSVMNFYKEHLPYLGNRLSSPQIYDHQYAGIESFITHNYTQAMFDSWGITSQENLEENLIRIFNEHKKEILDFFKDKPNSLYVLDVSQGNSFKKLATWLGEKTNENNFPWLHKQF